MGSNAVNLSSPFGRASTIKTTGRTARSARDSDSKALSLKRIIGSSIWSPTKFDSLASANCFVHTAGGVAIVTTLDDNLGVSQRFFRARPSATSFAPLASSSNISHSTTPSTEARRHSLTPFRDVGASTSGTSPAIGDWEGSPTSTTWTARERVKAVSCVSFSPDGRYLAVGEGEVQSGYHPRVMIFSIANDALSDFPVAIFTEHSHGVSAVAFSPDSRFLASLGSIQDGFLHIWAVKAKSGSARLCSSNKCTSYICVLKWIGKDTLITAGTRHVKLWRLNEPGPISPAKRFGLDGKNQSVPQSPSTKSLPGRNCLLGRLAETTFTCAAKLPNDRGVVCSERGDVCLIEEGEGNHRLLKVEETGFGITCIAIDPGGEYVWIGGLNGHIKVILVSEMLSSRSPSRASSVRSSCSTPVPDASRAHITYISVVAGHLVTIDSNHTIKISSIMSSEALPGPGSSALELAAHGEGVLGVNTFDRPMQSGAVFFTWSLSGHVLLWNLQGDKVDEFSIEIDQLADHDVSYNELRVVRASPATEFFLSGDRLGVFKVIDWSSRQSVFETKAHGAEILDVRVHQNEEVTMAASCSRDRTVQLFRKTTDSWGLVQTFNEHKASVSGLLFLNDGAFLLSCSGDRTIIVRGSVSKEATRSSAPIYVHIRTLMLKSAPVSMVSSSEMTNTLFVSATDRFIHEYDISSGKSIRSFRASDPDSSDAVVMDKLILGGQNTGPDGSLILAGVSSKDKSIRIYDSSGALLGREWGHTEGVTGLALLNHSIYGSDDASDGKITIISTGADGTIIMWDFTPDPAGQQENSMSNGSVTARQPMRKVLSKADLARYHQKTSSTSTDESTPARTLQKKPSNLSVARTSGPLTPTIAVQHHKSLLPGHKSSNSTSRKSSFSASSISNSNDSENQTQCPSLTTTTSQTKSIDSLHTSTEDLCTALRAYRQKLHHPSTSLSTDIVKDLERELDLTRQAVAKMMSSSFSSINGTGFISGGANDSNGTPETGPSDKTTTNSATTGLSEDVLIRLLGQYSDRLMESVDEKLNGRSTTSSHSAVVVQRTATAAAATTVEEEEEVDEPTEEEENKDNPTDD